MGQGRRLAGAMIALFGVLAFGIVGYLFLGFSPLDAVYMTVMTVSTVGFGEVEPLSRLGVAFTVVLILVGVSSALYAFSVIVEGVIEGRVNELLGRRRMNQSIASVSGHVIVCGWGLVGHAIAEEIAETKQELVIVEIEPDKVNGVEHRVVIGDATTDEVLRQAGIDRAAALVAAVDGDAENSFITLSARSLNPDLFIVSRARSRDSGEKLMRAGADRVVNPQSIGGVRMAAFVLHPNVAEFVDVVMHERSLEFRLEEVAVVEGSPLVGKTLRDTHLRDETGALVLALRRRDGSFETNPSPDEVISKGEVIIAIGTQEELQSLIVFVAP